MTPMIDVTFQLIIFFILAGQIASQELAQLVLYRPLKSVALKEDDPRVRKDKVVVNIPSIHGAEKDKVKLTDSGEAKCHKVGPETIDLDDIEKLERILKDEFEKSKKPEEFHVEIRADHRVHFGYVLPVMDAAVRAGIPKMNITALLKGRGEEEPK